MLRHVGWPFEIHRHGDFHPFVRCAIFSRWFADELHIAQHLFAFLGRQGVDFLHDGFGRAHSDFKIHLGAAKNQPFAPSYICSPPPRTPHKVVNQRAEKMQEDDYQHPNDFFSSTQSVVGNRVNQHPNPEREQQKTQGQKKQKGEYSETAYKGRMFHTMFPFC